MSETPDYTYVTFNVTADTTDASSVQLRTDESRSKKLSFVCESDSPKGVLNISEFDVAVSSTFVPASALGLLRHDSKFLPLDSGFRKGMFTGKGWCANTTGPNEFVEINFHRKDVYLTGLVLQEGVVSGCSYRISRLVLEYRRPGEPWEKTDPVPLNITDGNATVLWLNEAVIADAIRVRPLEVVKNGGSGCVKDLFCLRLGLRGKYLAGEHRSKVVSNQKV